MDYLKLITIEPGKRSGQPCIRGMRITVRDVLEYLAGGMTVPELLADFPELTADDVRACLAYATSLLPRTGRTHRPALPPPDVSCLAYRKGAETECG
jgi:uncharacterized protein (DUF433 family)